MSIQEIYRQYSEGKFLVNRKYQRKLVWTVDEKQFLIDSILSDFPIPLILLAKTEDDKYEIIDVTGRLIETGQVEKDNQVNRVSTNRLATGVYILKLYTNKGVVTKKIIKK